MSWGKWSSADILGAVAGTTAGTGGWFGLWWSRLSFINGTEDMALVVTIGSALAGLLLDQYLTNQRLARGKKLVYGIVALPVSIALFLAYNAYVVWAIKGYYMEGVPVFIGYAALFLATMLWSFAFAVGGRGCWNQIFHA